MISFTTFTIDSGGTLQGALSPYSPLNLSASSCPSLPNQLTKSPSVKPIYGWGEMRFIEGGYH